MKPKEIEDFNQRIYEHEYSVAQISINTSSDPNEYFQQLVQIKLGFIKEFCKGKKILDIGCGSGDFLFILKDLLSEGYGIDYTDKAINAANVKKEFLKASQLKFIKANARNLPFEDQSMDVVFSFSAFAYMPNSKDVIKEMARVIKSEGILVLEIGNKRSLNTLVCEAYPEYAKTCHVKVSHIKEILNESGFRIIRSRAFGILPFWGQRPSWLRFLLHPKWKEILQKRFKGKMLDEWLSNMVIFKSFAYRHFIFCRKV